MYVYLQILLGILSKNDFLCSWLQITENQVVSVKQRMQQRNRVVARRWKSILYGRTEHCNIEHIGNQAVATDYGKKSLTFLQSDNFAKNSAAVSGR